jgi:ABC-type Fe3+ transport system substrate-binding protein
MYAHALEDELERLKGRISDAGEEMHEILIAHARGRRDEFVALARKLGSAEPVEGEVVIGEELRDEVVKALSSAGYVAGGRDSSNAAVKVLEHLLGRPTQKVEAKTESVAFMWDDEAVANAVILKQALEAAENGNGTAIALDRDDVLELEAGEQLAP